MQNIYVIIEEWNNCADYPEDLQGTYRLLCSTDSFKMAEQIISDRKRAALSYLDAKYLDETELRIKYAIDEYKVECKLIEDNPTHTYCGDSFVWHIVSTELIEG